MEKIYTQREIDLMESTDDPAISSLLYRGRAGIRASGINISITDQEIATLYECSRNPVSFIHQYGIVYPGGNRCNPILNSHQVKTLMDHGTEKFYPVFLGRQSGLTSSIQFMALHDLIFKCADIFDIVICCVKMERSKDIIKGIMEMYSELPFYMKPGVVSMEAESVKFENGARISAWSPDRHLGRNIDVLFVDDFHHMGRRAIESILNKWLPFMTSITSTRVFIGCSGSIPSELNDVEFFTLFRCYEFDWLNVK
jgi:hypothetical protein